MSSHSCYFEVPAFPIYLKVLKWKRYWSDWALGASWHIKMKGGVSKDAKWGILFCSVLPLTPFIWSVQFIAANEYWASVSLEVTISLPLYSSDSLAAHQRRSTFLSKNLILSLPLSFFLQNACTLLKHPVIMSCTIILPFQQRE